MRTVSVQNGAARYLVFAGTESGDFEISNKQLRRCGESQRAGDIWNSYSSLLHNRGGTELLVGSFDGDLDLTRSRRRLAQKDGHFTLTIQSIEISENSALHGLSVCGGFGNYIGAFTFDGHELDDPPSEGSQSSCCISKSSRFLAASIVHLMVENGTFSMDGTTLFNNCASTTRCPQTRWLLHQAWIRCGCPVALNGTQSGNLVLQHALVTDNANSEPHHKQILSDAADFDDVTISNSSFLRNDHGAGFVDIVMNGALSVEHFWTRARLTI